MLPVIIVGFAMITLGVALLILGEVPFVAGKRIPALRSRLIGLVLVSFLPLAFALRQGMTMILGDEALDALIFTWVLCGILWFAVFVMLFRVMAPKKSPRPKGSSIEPAVDEKNPFGEAEISEIPAKKPMETASVTKSVEKARKSPPAKAAKKPADNANPFDFS